MRKLKLQSLKRPLCPPDGAWVDVAGLPPGHKFRVRPVSAPEYRAASANLQAAFGMTDKVSPLDIQRGDVEDGQLIADHLLTGWEGFDEPYSPELAKQLLTDPAFDEFRRRVLAAARSVAQAQLEFVDAAEKN